MHPAALRPDLPVSPDLRFPATATTLQNTTAPPVRILSVPPTTSAERSALPRFLPSLSGDAASSSGTAIIIPAETYTHTTGTGFQRHDVAVAHCPQSNAKLASGMAPLVELLARGIRVGLGTDGPASNNDLDLWEEIRLAAMFARLRQQDAAALPAADALNLATRGSGTAIGRPDLGVLAAGAKADMIAVDLDTPAFVPLLEDAQMIEHLVWSASSRLVTDVWVAGTQVVEQGQCLTVDVERARHEVEARARRLQQAAT